MKNHHISKKLSPLSFAINSIDSQDADNNNNYGGSYIDLGSIEITPSSSEEASILENLFHETSSSLMMMNHDRNNNSNNIRSGTSVAPTTNNTSDDDDPQKQWRSNHWIVLIDDEPSIRLAIGDYLHSMGYTMITACDGPLSFLDVLLYSCGWSFGAAAVVDDDYSSSSSSSRPPPP